MAGSGMWADSVIALGIDPDGFPRPLAVDSAGMLVSSGPVGVTDHGALTGLADDDHTQYALVDGTRAFTGNVTIGDVGSAGAKQLQLVNTAKTWSLIADVTLDRLVLSETAAKLTAWGSTIPAMLLGSTVGLGWTSGAVDATSADVFFYRGGANSVRQGAPNNTTPATQTFTLGESALAGTANNTAGGSSVLRSGLGTGTGVVANITLQTPTIGASGTAAQVYATRVTVDSAGVTLAGVLTVSGAGASSFGGNLTVGPNGVLIGSTSPFINALGAASFYLRSASGQNLIIDPQGGGTAFVTTTLTVQSGGASSFAGQLNVAGPLALRSASSPDVFLYGDAANLLAQRNGTAAQGLRVYNTYTDASNYERFDLAWSVNEVFLEAVAAGTGTRRNLVFGGATVRFRTAGFTRWTYDASGHFLASDDNTYDIGAAGATRPRSIYVGTDIVAGNAVRTSHVAAATPTGGSSGDIKIGNGKIWVNDAGTWKSVAVA